MLANIALAASLGTCALASALPRAELLPMYDGFPNPSPSQLHQIEVFAGGGVLGGPPPPKVAPSTQDSIQLIGFGEALGAAFLDQLEYNLTTSQPGFDASSIPADSGHNHSEVADRVRAIRSIQEVHGLSAAAVANATGTTPFYGCPEYVFPVTNLSRALEFIIVHQQVTAGVAGDIGQAAADIGDNFIIRPLVGIVAAEGVMTGYLSQLWTKITGLPLNDVPFATAVSRQLYLSFFIQAIPDPDACPGLKHLTDAYPRLPHLGVSSLPEPSNQNGTFTLEAPAEAWQWNTTYYGVIMNQQNAPIVQSISNISNNTVDGVDIVSFDLGFPYDANLINGLVTIVLTTSEGPFADVDAVTNATAFGPAFLVNNI